MLDAHLDSVSRSEACDVNHFDSAFTNAFLKTDEEFGKVRLLLLCVASPSTQQPPAHMEVANLDHHRSMTASTSECDMASTCGCSRSTTQPWWAQPLWWRSLVIDSCTWATAVRYYPVPACLPVCLHVN